MRNADETALREEAALQLEAAAHQLADAVGRAIGLLRPDAASEEAAPPAEKKRGRPKKAEEKPAPEPAPEPEEEGPGVDDISLPGQEELEACSDEQLDTLLASVHLEDVKFESIEDKRYALQYIFTALREGELPDEPDEPFLMSVFGVENMEGVADFLEKLSEEMGLVAEEPEGGESEGEPAPSGGTEYEAIIAEIRAENDKDPNIDWSIVKDQVIAHFAAHPSDDVDLEAIKEYDATKEDMAELYAVMLETYRGNEGQIHDEGVPYVREDRWWADGGPIMPATLDPNSDYVIDDPEGAKEYEVTQPDVDQEIAAKKATLGSSQSNLFILFGDQTRIVRVRAVEKKKAPAAAPARRFGRKK